MVVSDLAMEEAGQRQLDERIWGRAEVGGEQLQRALERGRRTRALEEERVAGKDTDGAVEVEDGGDGGAARRGR